ncbi:MAG: NADP-dependent malic enzyme [Magnetovibrio sp.]|nr:NADP-dependent malic enzyme [Magnetovibrio sp.]
MTRKVTREAALSYHEFPKPGKLCITPTKPLANQRDLSLAYSPGVADACEAIVADEAAAARYTIRGNLVGVVTNGSAVLGLGDIGPLAAKPVMEGKAVLFKKFAGIDVFDIEMAEKDPHKLADAIAMLEPTFGAINLEDIKAPECFIVEETLRERMNIPVFHDDQHGTAIVVGTAVLNGLRLVNKKIEDIKIVSTGGGAAGIACLNLLLLMGAKRENVYLSDHLGVVYKGRTDGMTEQKNAYAQDTDARELSEVIGDADLFLGLSAPGVLKPEMVKAMADQPIILALANPEPEIRPEAVREVRDDAIIATGRSDYPNQVNNVLCFPFIFRGALDVGATTVNDEMKLACVKALADLAHAESSAEVAAAYRGEDLVFGPEYVIPKPFDPRLIVEIAPAVARAAMDSGVATRPIEDFDSYIESLERFVYRSGMLMKPVIEAAKRDVRRVVFAEGEDERVLRCVQALLDEGLAEPILVGRPEVINRRAQKLGLRLGNIEMCNPEDDPRYRDYWQLYHQLLERKGVSPEAAKTIIRTNTTAIAAIMLKRGEVDAMICGTYGQYKWHQRYVTNVIGQHPECSVTAALSVLIMPTGTLFLADTYVNPDPTAEQVAEITMLAAQEIRRFGIEPKVALLSHSNFGNVDNPSAVKMRRAVQLLDEQNPDFEYEGEMHADAALDEELRKRIFPSSRLNGVANLLIMPNLDAANTSSNLLKVMGNGLRVGPVLLGGAQPAHIVTPSVTPRGLFNLTALACVEAQVAEDEA